jgi:hypothetical protein
MERKLEKGGHHSIVSEGWIGRGAVFEPRASARREVRRESLVDVLGTHGSSKSVAVAPAERGTGS